MVQSTIFSQRKNKCTKVVPQTSRHHYTKAHKCYKIFNRKTFKISSCCMKNMGSIISFHNKQVLQPRNKKYGCNCRKKENCSLDNKWLTPNILYEAQISNSTNNEHKKYLGEAETSFEERYSNHTRNFKHKKIWRVPNFQNTFGIWRVKAYHP